MAQRYGGRCRRRREQCLAKTHTSKTTAEKATTARSCPGIFPLCLSCEVVAETMTEKAARERLDKWLWQARFYRSRILAQEAAVSGRVRVNGNRVEKPGVGIKC